MKRFIKDLATLSLLFIFLQLPVLIYGSLENVNKDSLWELKLYIKVKGSFKSLGKQDISGTYVYNVVLNGSIGLDEDRDFIYYYQEGEVKSFMLYYVDLKTGKRSIIKEKKTISQEIEFIIRNGRNIYLEFTSKELDISKSGGDINIKLSLPISYGILKRKSNRKYRKGIKEGSNKIFWKENLLYSKLNFKKDYNWTWANISKELQESHSVKTQLYIKIK